MFRQNAAINRILDSLQCRKQLLNFISHKEYHNINRLILSALEQQLTRDVGGSGSGHGPIGIHRCLRKYQNSNGTRHFSISAVNRCSNGKKSEPPPSSTTEKPADKEKTKPIDAITIKTNSPLEIKTKAGKLIVTAADIENDFKSQAIAKSNEAAADIQSTSINNKIELETKKGKLVVHAKVDSAGKLLDKIVLERPKVAGAQASDGSANMATVMSKPSDALKDKPTPVVKVSEEAAKPKRSRVDFTRSSLERNFITPGRAMSDFLLKMSDLESLPKTKRRSPYEQEPPIVVYWRKDVEEKAIQVWGSRENLLRECLKREIERKRHQQNIFTVKRRLRDYRREMGSRTGTEFEPGLKGSSGRVVITAIVINATNFVFKTCAWLYTGSHSMFAESIHSLADTINQVILAYGIHKSVQIADPDHPYGYANMKYVSSLISGVGIFCVGTGLSFYHGIMGLMHPVPAEDFFWAFCILGGSLASEGATLLVAVNTIRQAAKKENITFREYVIRGQDPCVNVVLFEDAAAVTSVALAAGCMALSTWTGSSAPDAIGSLLVGCMLGAVASCIIYANVQALVGRSISAEQLDKINSELESDVMIRAIHDVKGIDMGNSLVRYKAEVDFDGRELTRFYLDKQELSKLLDEVKGFSTVEELETFILKHGENIVDLMGGEIDRIEMNMRKKFPEVRHCDLEIL